MNEKDLSGEATRRAVASGCGPGELAHPACDIDRPRPSARTWPWLRLVGDLQVAQRSPKAQNMCEGPIMARHPLILVTNDDGLNSPGLVAAPEAVADLGDLLIAAPASQQTSMSRAVMTGPTVGAVQARELTILGKPVTGYAVTGTPAQAVTHAMVELTGQRPDLCVSGVNYGENIGADLATSGTIGAALEAHAYGVPGLAVSVQADIAQWRSHGEPGTSPAGWQARSWPRASLRTSH